MIKKLSEYKKKRDLTKSPEPKAHITSAKNRSLNKKSLKKNIFVVQQHHATHMHFDFRIQIGSILKSWAIPKGPSTNPRIKRLAALTEDHPLDYAKFEGIIPTGYGAGTVIVWDTGTYENLNKINGRKASMQRAFESGFIKIALKGKKLKGAYALVHLKDKNWLLVKVRDEHANAKTNPTRTKPESVLSKTTIKELDKKFKAKKSENKIEFSHPEKVYYPKTHKTKGHVLAYYQKIANSFLAHSKDHLIVMQRFPEGIAGENFFQKQIPDYFPAWIKRKSITLSDGSKQSLVMLDTPESLLYLANQGVLVFHSWLSPKQSVNKPDKIVFDLDPAKKDLKTLRFLARELKVMLESHGLVPFIMTTGSRGYHVVAPITPEHSFEKIRAFAKHVATKLATQHSDIATTQISKTARKGRVFVDYLRNSYGATSVAPYSLRATESAAIATPIEWQELSRVEPQSYSIKNIFSRLARKGDAWESFEKSRKKLKLGK